MNQLMQREEMQNGRMQPPAIDAMTRAEIDIQISTAHAYPRSLTRVARNVTDLVTMSQAAAAECIYSLPRGGKPIVGPSIRLAEILFSQWGNCTGGSRTVEVNKKEGYVEAEGVFHDLETNAKTVRRVRRRITARNGSVFNDDMIIVTANAAGSIAFRNAVLAGVPKAVWNEAYGKAEQVIRGDVKTLPERREQAFKAMAAFGLSAEDVCLILGVDGHKDIGLDELVVISGLHNSLMQEETTAEKLLAEAEENAPDTSRKRKPNAKKAKAEDEEQVVEDEKAAEPPKQEKPADAAEKPKEDAEAQKPAEPDTSNDAAGTLLDDPEVVKAQRQILETFKMDATDSNIEAALQFYAEQIDQMKKLAPSVYAELQEFVEAARNETE